MTLQRRLILAVLIVAPVVWLLTIGLTLARLIALFRTPLELYPDEAQYWLWSRTLSFGFVSRRTRSQCSLRRVMGSTHHATRTPGAAR